MYSLALFGILFTGISYSFIVPLQSEDPNWTNGYDGLPSSMYGCPDESWEHRYINLTLPANLSDIFWESNAADDYLNQYSSSRTIFLHILGPYSSRNFQFNVCVRRRMFNNSFNILGNFCLYKMEASCDKGQEEGSITVNGYMTEIRGFNTNTTHKDGGVVIYFCCSNNNITFSGVMPNTFPFVLFKGSTADTCQQISDMTSIEDTVYITQTGIKWRLNGTLPKMNISSTHVGITFCVYHPKSYGSVLKNADLENVTKSGKIQSVGRPCYSSAYIESQNNHPYFVVDDVDTIETLNIGFTTVQMYRPWFQIDLQQFVKVTHIIRSYKISDSAVTEVDLIGIYVSRDQWDFLNHGALACFLGLARQLVMCRRPTVGQYVTLTMEYDDATILQLNELRVYGDSMGCGRFLGMISGDIKEFQIETSSNYKDIQYSRALYSTRGWCSSPTDKKPWLMVDLIMPTTIQGIALHGWYLVQRRFIDSFMIEYGITKNSLGLYGEDGSQPMIFRTDAQGNVYSLQKFWFLTEISARYIKIIVIEPVTEIACLKLEIVGCTSYSSRNIYCEESRNSSDFGFVETREMSFNFENKAECCRSTDMTLENCQNLTIEKGYIGNVYNTEENVCCLNNISTTNRHYKKMWDKPSDKFIVSERLCLSDFIKPNLYVEIGPLVSGQIKDIYSPLFPSSYPRGFSSEMRLTTVESVFLRVTITYVSLARSANKSQLTQIGQTALQPSYCQDTLTLDVGTGHLIQITTENQQRYRHASFISKGQLIILHFKSCFQYLYSDNNVYQLTIETIDHPGCGVDGTKFAECVSMPTAYITSYLYPALYTVADNNLWKIRGKYGQYIKLKFLELDVYNEDIITSYVEVFDLGLDASRSASFGRVSKATIPRTELVSSWHMMDVEFSVGNKETGRGFSGMYTLIDVTSDALHSLGCSNNWFQYGGNCYKTFYSFPTNQQKSEQECVKNGGHLVTITSEEEMAFIHSLLISQSIDKAYIGLRKKGNGYIFSDFVWWSGESLLYTAWYPGKTERGRQPDGFHDQKCTAIILDSIYNTHNWHDVPCGYDEIQYFICETMDNRSRAAALDERGRLLSFTLPYLLPSNTKKCANGEITSALVICDGYKDCSDGSDELDCRNECSGSQYQCDNGLCIHFSFYCDGIVHCADNSDEMNCEWPICSTTEWQCNNKQCIPADSRCNIKQDCQDGSDEENCALCSLSSFQCYDMSCISQERVCDKMPDCPGKYFEDETDCQTHIKQSSCEEWWRIGARSDGIYQIDFDSGAPTSVYCQFKEKEETYLVSTTFYYNQINNTWFSDSYQMIKDITFKFPKDLIKLATQNTGYTCSQTIRMTCYFQEIIGYSDNSVIIAACGNSCTCLKQNWSTANVNEVLSDNVEITNYASLPFDSYNPTLISYSDEGFSYLDVGPVLCTSEVPINSSSSKFLCDNGKLYDYESRCLLAKDELNDISVCRDMSHLHNCNLKCPLGFLKCPEGHCIAPSLVCDGISHCGYGYDELHCGNLTCMGLFRCQRSTTCLFLAEVCDGIKQCPYGEDEVGCNTTCPFGCVCDGFVFTCQCHDSIDRVIFNLSEHARKLDFTSSKFSSKAFALQNFPFLGQLILFNCSIRIIEPNSLQNSTNLIYLDLRFNKLEKLYANTFFGLNRLLTLRLEGNDLLTSIEPNTFLSLSNVLNLQLTGTQINHLKPGTFVGLDKLQILNISGNGLTAIEENAFHGLERLVSIDLTHNSIQQFFLKMFANLKLLVLIKTDSYVFCCLKPETVLPENCYPQTDEFSSCSDLLRNNVLRVVLWIVGIAALLGNVGVIAYRVIFESNLLRKPNGFYIMNLGIADMLMGIYLCIIALKDMYLRGEYILHDSQWKQSITCKVAGVIAFISTEASVNFIMLITIDIFLMVRFPFGRKKVTFTMAKWTTLTCWLITVSLALLPAFNTTYFSDSYYSTTAVCLSLPFSRHRLNGWEYSFVILVLYNCVSFLIIAGCQLSIFRTATSSSRIKAKRTQQDLSLARRLFLIVLTDFICWFPIGVMGIIALAGEVFPTETYSWIAVFVMPVNAALNPFLYTFSNIITKQKSELMSIICGSKFTVPKKDNRKYKDDLNNIFFASTFVDCDDELDLDHVKLSELLELRRFTPKECYILITQLTAAVSYLHKRFLTVCRPISPDIVVVCMDREKIKKLKVISRIRYVTSETETCEDVEGIGIFTKQLLKNTLLAEHRKSKSGCEDENQNV